jgi:hypothetical protein
MEETQVATKIQVRRDNAANFTSSNPTLASGEIAYETDTAKIKIGDGTTAWTVLSYFGTGGVTTGKSIAMAIVFGG